MVRGWWGVLGTFWAFVLLSPVHIVSPQLISMGECPKAPAMPNFNVTKYAGRWYDMEKFFFTVQATTACTTIDYLPNFDVDIRQIEGMTNTRLRNKGHTRFLSKDGSADLDLELIISQSPLPFSVHWPYRVLKTDYSNYTIKYTCIQIGPMRIEGMWILSKGNKETYKKQTRAKVHSILRDMGLPADKLIPSRDLFVTKCPW